MTSRLIPFGPHNLNISQVFFETALSRAFVNLKPITPGHVLGNSKRELSFLLINHISIVIMPLESYLKSLYHFLIE